MLIRIIKSALLAGAVAGVLGALLQLYFVQPVLLHAELYESGELVHFQGSASVEQPAEHDHGAHDHGHEPAEPSDVVRNGLSVLFTTLVYVGYAFMLIAVMALMYERGVEITPRSGVLWGAAGYIALQFAPAFSLPPEVPGVASADLDLRQYWWFATAAATAVALWLLAFGKTWPVWIVGGVLLFLPHIIGAPEPDAFLGTVPPELASLFASRSLGVGFVTWTLLGLFSGYFWNHKAVS